MKNRIAVITGGLSGIGLASAKELTQIGHTVIIGSRRCNTKQVSSIQNSLGEKAVFHQLDVSDKKSVTSFTNQIEKEFGHAEILINAAGIYEEAQIIDDDTSHWHNQIDINLTGPFLMTQALMPGMIKKKFGRIINIASTAGRVGEAGYSGYCASKAGLIALSKVTAIEGAPHNISCISISPTWVETPMMDNAIVRHSKNRNISKSNAKKALKSSNPQGRLVQPEEIASLIAFACGEACPGLSNEDIQINAGAIW